MGKKLNPEYRARMVTRQLLPKCAYCHRRGRRLVEHLGRLFHKTCIDRFEAAQRRHEAVVESAGRKRAERHAAIHDWWNMTPKQRRQIDIDRPSLVDGPDSDEGSLAVKGSVP